MYIMRECMIAFWKLRSKANYAGRIAKTAKHLCKYCWECFRLHFFIELDSLGLPIFGNTCITLFLVPMLQADILMDTNRFTLPSCLICLIIKLLRSTQCFGNFDADGKKFSSCGMIIAFWTTRHEAHGNNCHRCDVTRQHGPRYTWYCFWLERAHWWHKIYDAAVGGYMGYKKKGSRASL